jgi:hypothetical protein
VRELARDLRLLQGRNIPSICSPPHNARLRIARDDVASRAAFAAAVIVIMAGVAAALDLRAVARVVVVAPW